MDETRKKNKHAVAMGRKGGKARMKKMSVRELHMHQSLASSSRWLKSKRKALARAQIDLKHQADQSTENENSGQESIIRPIPGDSTKDL